MNRFKKFLRHYNYGFNEGCKITAALYAHMLVYAFTNALHQFTNKHADRYINHHNFIKKILLSGFQVENYSNKELVIKNNGIILNCRKFSSDLNVFNQIFICNYFDNVVKFIREHSIKVNTIIDLGANAGIVSVYFHAHFKNAKIITVEPDPENFKLLEKNMNSNAINGVNINRGIYKYKTKLYFDRSLGADKHWGIKLTEDPVSPDYIETTSIDDIVSQNKIEQIDLLKISIEGVEDLVFNEERANMDFIKIAKIIAIKIHDEDIVKTRIMNILAGNNFDFFQSGEFFIAHKL